MKLFAIIDKNNIIVDGWFADSYEEAEKDNPNFKVIEITKINSFYTIGSSI
jgi:hypothetical protein